MAAFGYVANAEQTAGALRGINMTVNLFPALLFIAASLCCLLWNMTDKDADEIRAKLHERHTAKED